MKVNVDASVVSGNVSFRIGWIARDHSGTFIEMESKLLPGCVQPSMAEALGVKEVLNWIKQCDMPAVIVESDFQAVVQAICHTVHMKSPFGMIISDCRRLLASLNNITIVFDKRSANKVANWLAKAACSYSCRRLGGGSVPTELTDILMAESLH